MGMVKCRECGNLKSSKAEVCPHCGIKPLRKKPIKKTSTFTWFILIILILIWYSISSMNDAKESAKTTSIKPGLTLVQKQSKEKVLLAELKKIAAAEIYTNMNKYDELLKMFPTNKKYIAKKSYYSKKVTSLESKIGKKPRVSSWDRVPFCVKNYIDQVAKDPDSVDFDSCTDSRFSERGWSTTCKYRANNSFGGKVLEVRTFTIRHDVVVNVSEI
ncbi:MAG: hypothetical protein J7L21_04580 [Sulfurimonas sp.]|nr:hypothetical protein [Sulfurimonas sp.]